MPAPASTIREDFDRIALQADEEWDRNSHYHPWLLRRVPRGCATALEIGCGTGAFARELAARCGHVLAMDLSPNMVRLASARCRRCKNVDFEVADVMERALPADQFDCIVSIATLHHLPLEEAMVRLRDALAPGGVLLVLDLFQQRSAFDFLRSVAAKPVSIWLQLARAGMQRRSPEARAAWGRHDLHDSFPTMDEVRAACRHVLPGAAVRVHLLWRYSIEWVKPAPMRPTGPAMPSGV